MGRSLNNMVDLQDPKILGIIIFDIIGIGVFVWFLSSRLSLKLKVIEQRKEKNAIKSFNQKKKATRKRIKSAFD